MDLKNLKTQDAKPIQWNIEAPSVAIVKLVGFVYTESVKKGTPCIQAVLTQQGVTDFPTKDQDFPAAAYHKKEGFTKTFHIDGPLAVIDNYVGKSEKGEWYAWKIDNSLSFIQVLLKWAIACGVEDEFRALELNEENPKEITEKLNSVFKGKVFAQVFKKEVSQQKDAMGNVLNSYDRVGLYQYDPFCAPAAAIMDLKEAMKNVDPDSLVSTTSFTKEGTVSPSAVTPPAATGGFSW